MNLIKTKMSYYYSYRSSLSKESMLLLSIILLLLKSLKNV
nr:MAG TPA: hypothetical protein [Caudoviricetes sp.]